MKWLIIQSDGEHKGQDGWTANSYLRECFAIQYALKNNGHESDIWGLRHSNFKDIPDFEKYDAIFCIENYETQWLPDFTKIKSPLKIQWMIDLHCRDENSYAKESQGFNIILNSTRLLMDGYSKRLTSSQRQLWFPNGTDDRYFTKTKDVEKKNDVIFVGSSGMSRENFINSLVNDPDIKMKKIFATGKDMLDLISSTKIHFNKNISCDINYRTFETIGLGTCLITDYDKDLEALGFKDEENCLLYRDFGECKNKIVSTLRNGNWNEIAKKGYELSKKNTYTQRVKELLAKI